MAAPAIPYPSLLIPEYDLAFLRDFCGGDEAQVRHFIKTFEVQYPLEIERLEAALERQDREAIYQAAHSFKPQLEFMGLTKAANLAASLEKGARAGKSIGELERLLEELKRKLSNKP